MIIHPASAVYRAILSGLRYLYASRTATYRLPSVLAHHVLLLHFATIRISPLRIAYIIHRPSPIAYPIMLSTDIQRAQEAIQNAQAILICAGAGMGVDSGLPDFRGTEGFWRAYPPYQKLGLRFEELANPQWFRQDPALGWGFYGNRLNLYRQTKPHAGFDILRRWCTEAGRTHFVFTSNVDGHFQRSGFSDDSIYEVHGSIHHMQCVDSCGVGILSADPFEINVDHESMRAAKPLPLCPECGCLLRPNILMFGDWYWDSDRSDQQQTRFGEWLRSIDGPLVVIECGAGTAIPTVRHQSEMLVARLDATLIRINPRDYRVPNGQIAIAANTLEALVALDH